MQAKTPAFPRARTKREQFLDRLRGLPTRADIHDWSFAWATVWTRWPCASTALSTHIFLNLRASRPQRGLGRLPIGRLQSFSASSQLCGDYAALCGSGRPSDPFAPTPLQLKIAHRTEKRPCSMRVLTFFQRPRTGHEILWLCTELRAQSDFDDPKYSNVWSMMRVVFMGTPEFAVPTLMEISRCGLVPVTVYTRAPARGGRRGLEITRTPVHSAADALGIPVLTPTSLRDVKTQQVFNSLAADVAIVVAYGLLLPLPILTSPRFGCINLHPSLLPSWRGAAPIQRAIMAGDTETGVDVCAWMPV